MAANLTADEFVNMVASGYNMLSVSASLTAVYIVAAISSTKYSISHPLVRASNANCTRVECFVDARNNNGLWLQRGILAEIKNDDEKLKKDTEDADAGSLKKGGMKLGESKSNAKDMEQGKSKDNATFETENPSTK